MDSSAFAFPQWLFPLVVFVAASVLFGLGVLLGWLL